MGSVKAVRHWPPREATISQRLTWGFADGGEVGAAGLGGAAVLVAPAVVDLFVKRLVATIPARIWGKETRHEFSLNSLMPCASIEMELSDGEIRS